MCAILCSYVCVYIYDFFLLDVTLLNRTPELVLCMARLASVLSIVELEFYD
jgi:hypothetical protein